MTWADSDYTYRKKITVDHTKVKEDLTNYPMLIYVTDADLKDVANSGHVESSSGYDICFYDSTNTTKLKHELVTYTNTTGLIEAYVKISTLDKDADTEIYMYYGNDDVVSDQSSTDTWNANYSFVCHMKDLTTSTVKDSTSNGRNGTKTSANNPAVTASGKFGNAQTFDNDTTDIIYMSDFHVNKITISAWTKVTASSDKSEPIVCKQYTSASSNPYYEYMLAIARTVDPDVVNLRVTVGGTNYSLIGGVEVGDNTWHYIVGTYDGETMKVITDGTNISTKTDPSGNISDYGTEIAIGNYRSTYNTQSANGIIDEVRIMSEAMTTNWIETEYNNQSSPATFMDFDIEEIESAGTAHTVTLSDSFSIAESLSTLKGTGYSRSLSDTLTILESLVTLSGIGHTRNLTELLTISESLTRQSEYKRSITDTLTIAESLLKQSGYNKSLSDSISISESLSKIHGINILLSDTLSISDSFSRQVDYKRVISDTLTIKDKLVKTYTPGSTIIYDFFDPRITIRNTIANVFDLFLTGDTQKAIEVTYNGNDIQIPIYLVEETKSNNSPLPPMPFIELGLSCGAEPVNVLATGRKRVARVTATIYYTKNDDVDQIAFGKLISDELCNLIRTYQCSMFAIDFINVNNTGRVIEEYRENQVVYVKKMEIYVLHYYL